MYRCKSCKHEFENKEADIVRGTVFQPCCPECESPSLEVLQKQRHLTPAASDSATPSPADVQAVVDGELKLEPWRSTPSA